MIMIEDEKYEIEIWEKGQRRYTRLCKALSKDYSSGDVYKDFMLAFRWRTAQHNYTFFTALGADKYAWMDGPHIEVVYRAMLVRLAGG
jgi:hypothetical protein